VRRPPLVSLVRIRNAPAFFRSILTVRQGRKLRKAVRRKAAWVRSFGFWALPAVWQLRRAERAVSGVVGVPIGRHRRFQLRAGTRDTDVFRQHFEWRQLFGPMRSTSDGVVLDLGAHIGAATEAFRRQYPAAYILSVEMDPFNVECCRINHHKTPNQKTIHAAIWSESGEVEIDDVGEGNWALRVRSKGNHRAEENLGMVVPALRFSDLLHQEDITAIAVLKIDIEGSEAELLESSWREIFSITDLVMMEIHDWIPGVRDRVESVFQLARKEFNLEFSKSGEFTCIRSRGCWDRLPGSAAVEGRA
jgi:FkbM family methyltransferase